MQYIPDDRIMDGGAPYTDEELAIIGKEDIVAQMIANAKVLLQDLEQDFEDTANELESTRQLRQSIKRFEAINGL